jgi:hypothetical protein
VIIGTTWIAEDARSLVVVRHTLAYKVADTEPCIYLLWCEGRFACLESPSTTTTEHDSSQRTKMFEKGVVHEMIFRGASQPTQGLGEKPAMWQNWVSMFLGHGGGP